MKKLLMSALVLSLPSGSAFAKEKHKKASGKKKAPAAAAPAASAGGCEDDKDFTERFEATNQECGSKISGGIIGKEMNASQCSNISDGLRANCQDAGGANKAKVASSIKKVCCHYDAAAKKVKVELKGGTLHAYFNIDTVEDPSSGVRCQVAKLLGLKEPSDGINCSKY